MRRERLRFIDIETAKHSLGRLTGLNLSVLEGEIVIAAGIRGSGKRIIRDIVAGIQKPSAGAMFINEQKISYLDETTFLRGQIYCVESKRHFIEEMTVAENIALLGNTRERGVFYDADTAQANAKTALDLVELNCGPQTKVKDLSDFEVFLLCMAMAVLAGGKLLVINNESIYLAPNEYHKMRELFLKLRDIGISLLLLEDNPDPLGDIADKIVVVYGGRDVKTVSHMGLSFPKLHEQFLGEPASEPMAGAVGGEPLCTFTAGSASLTLREQEVAGFFDTAMDETQNAFDFLQNILRTNNAFFTFRDGFVLNTDTLCDGGIGYIPENSGQHLIENLSIEENLLLPINKRMNSFGVINGDISRYLKAEADREFGISAATKLPAGLSSVKRKLISIYRWVINKPRLLLIESPDFNMDFLEQKKIYTYLKKVSASGIAVLVFSGNLNSLQEGCEKIIYTNGPFLMI